MNVDALVLTLLAIADLALLVHLRRRHGRRQRMERLMVSLRLAIHRANSVQELRPRRRLLKAG